MSGVRIVEVDLDDDAALAAHVAAADRLDPARIRSVEMFRRRRAATLGDLLLDAYAPDGTIVGMLEADMWAVFGPSHPSFSIAAEPGREDVLDALFDRLAAWELVEGEPQFTAHQRSPEPALVAWLERRGFRQTGTRDLVVRAVVESDRDLPVVAPEGVEVVLLRDRPELERAAEDLLNDAAADIPSALSEGLVARTTIREQCGVGPDGDLPELVFLAVAGDRLVGMALLQLTTEGAAAHRMTGVARAWRGRGIASALKACSIRWSAQNGIGLLAATNDDANRAMRVVNANFGYALRSTILMLHRACDSGGAGTSPA